MRMIPTGASAPSLSNVHRCTNVYNFNGYTMSKYNNVSLLHPFSIDDVGAWNNASIRQKDSNIPRYVQYVRICMQQL